MPGSTFGFEPQGRRDMVAHLGRGLAIRWERSLEGVYVLRGGDITGWTRHSLGSLGRIYEIRRTSY